MVDSFIFIVVFSNIPASLTTNKNRITKIMLQSLPSQRYRRQAVRNNLDIVGKIHYFSDGKRQLILNVNAIWFDTVSIGGIMGLFLGASILSAVELVYFFTVRLIGTAIARKTNAGSIRPTK